MAIKTTRLKAIASKIITKKAKPGGNPPKKPTARKGPKKVAAKKPTAAKKAKGGRPRKDPNDTGKAGVGKGRKGFKVKMFGAKYFDSAPKAKGAGGGTDYTLKGKYRIEQVKLSKGYGTTKKRYLLIDKFPKGARPAGKLPSIREITEPGWTRNGKKVIKIKLGESTYKKRTKRVVRTAGAKVAAERTRKSNKRRAGGGAPAKKAPAKGKRPTSKAKKAKKPASKGTSRIKTAAM